MTDGLVIMAGWALLAAWVVGLAVVIVRRSPR
jgi:hypothetical protein